MAENTTPPIRVEIETTNETPPGEHELEIIFLYRSEGEGWQKTRDTISFHIQTEAEEIEYEFMMNEHQFTQLNQDFSNLSIQYQQLNIILTILGVLFGAYVVIPPLKRYYNRRKNINEKN